MNTIENYLPQAPEPDKDHPSINAYRSLGMMALLDIDYWQGESETPLGEYYTSRLTHMKNGTVLIIFSNDKRPIGYATWVFSEGVRDEVLITRQAAPFGNHLDLQEKVKKRIPHGTKVLSRHFRSAREVQAAW